MGNQDSMDHHTTTATRRETPLERDDRNFIELLQELRVIQTGVQILFAFLLTLAFTQRFKELDSLQRGVYVTTLLLAVLAAVLFTAPAALHRGLFRRRAKRRIVDVSSRLAASGLAVIALALTGAVLLVVDVVLGRAAGTAAGAGVLVLCATMWAGLPWVLGRNLRRRPGPEGHAGQEEAAVLDTSPEPAGPADPAGPVRGQARHD